MKIVTAVSASIIFMCSANAYAGNCGAEYKDENISTIADSLAIKALQDHRDEFKSPAPKQNKKMPWTLSTQEDIREFVDDILSKKKKATRDGQTKLNVTSKELSKNRIAFWENETGTFVVYDPDNNACGTAHRPDNGKKDYDEAT